MNASQNKLWMVKSAGQVIGPYVTQQIQDLLKNRVIVPLDEITRPCGRWEYIRDTPVFAKAVEELRLRNIRGVSDDTTTQADELSGVTDTISSAQQPDDLTTDIIQPKAETVQDILFHSIEDEADAKKRYNPNVFTHEGDINVRTQVEKSSKWIWAFTSVIILITLSFVIFQQFVAKPIKDRSVLEESIASGIDSLESGDYARALDFFKKANEIDPEDSSIYLYLGMLTVQVDGQGFEGRKILEKLMTLQDKDLKRVLTGIGLAQLKEGDYKAAEMSFNKALDIDPLFQPALINLGATAFYLEDWARASNHLQLAVKEGSADGIEILMLTESQIKLFNTEKEKRYLIDALAYLTQFLEKAHNYNLEAHIAATYISYLLGQKQNIYRAIDQALDMDTIATESHRQNLFLHRAIASWSLVAQWCLKLTHDLDPNSHVIAFEALCLLKTGDLVEANRKIDDALAQTPKDPYVLSAYALVLSEMNSSDRALVAIDKALANEQNTRSLQARRLKARHCRQLGDVNCQLKYWTEILEVEPNSLSALAGLAQVNLNSNNIDEAKKYLLRGLSVSNSYRPLFSINKIISRVEDRTKARGL